MSTTHYDNLIEVRGLKKYFPARGKLPTGRREVVRAVDGVSFNIPNGKTFGLVGESGCGKSTTGRCILRLIEPTAGEVRFGSEDILRLNNRELRQKRREMQIIFQDPYSSLNPRMRVADIIREPLIIHDIGTRSERRERVEELLQLVGLEPEHGARYPHQFSGGQRQRVGIARALALNPKFIVCDEAVSALDVSVQAQIVNLLQDLQQRLGLTYLFISHGLAIVEHISDHVGIMYAGKLVEIAPSDEIFRNPLHVYTRALLSAIPTLEPDHRRTKVVVGAEDGPSTSLSDVNRQDSNASLNASGLALEAELIEVSPDHWLACT